MELLKDFIQTADWKQEKHVPTIEVNGGVGKDSRVEVTVTVGKEIPHPNTTAHHIDWLQVFFIPEGSKFPYLIGEFRFGAHGASSEGPDTSGVYSHPVVRTFFTTEKPGKIVAISSCNIHGIWGSVYELTR